MKSKNIQWHNSVVTRIHRERSNGHQGAVVWFTGLSGSGKSTLAHAVEQQLYELGCHTFVLDGDNVRHGLCADLGFTNLERTENIRRVGEVTKLFVEAGTIVMTAFISPFKTDRDRVRALLSHNDFIEVYCNCPVEVCEERDVKGLYERARVGKIADFTGISSPYEPPTEPSVIVNTSLINLEDAVQLVISKLYDRGIIR
jgi:adenylylsulfate kinase